MAHTYAKNKWIFFLTQLLQKETAVGEKELTVDLPRDRLKADIVSRSPIS